MSTRPEDFVGLVWHECVHRAILIVSINAKKAGELYERGDPKALRVKAVAMAEKLRGQRGVRHTEAVVLNRWWPDPPSPRAPHQPEPPRKAPWKPCGALVMVEASKAEDLEKYVRALLEAAKAIDQNAMEFMGTDIW